MRALQIRNHVRKEPFEPIRIHISDGSHYDVRHPEMIFVTQFEIAIGVDPSEDDLPTRMIFCDPIHVTRIEPINGRKPRTPRKRKP